MSATPTNTSSSQRLKNILMHPAGYTFLLTNLVMLIGLLWLGWEGQTIVAAFFMETIIIGGFNVLKMLAIYFLNPNREDPANESTIRGLFTIPFFIGFYSLFIFVQLLVFVGFQNFNTGAGFPNPIAYLKTNLGHEAVTIIGNFIIGQTIILITVFIAQKRYRTVTLQRQMFSPFARLFIQQLVVIISGFIIHSYHNSNTPAILLIVFKTMIDLIMQQMDLNRHVPKPEQTIVPMI